MITNLIIAGLIGYNIGSIPFAYLVTRWSTGMDLRQEGSRNIGTLNSFEVTRKKSVGLIVLVADLLKGLLPIFVSGLYGYSEGIAPMAVGLIVGHCYPIWLKFHGGRGLATAAGITLAVNPLLTAIWILFFFLGFLIKRHVHFGSIIATIGTAVSLLIMSDTVISSTTLGLSHMADQPQMTVIVTYLILAVIMTRHIGPLRDLWKGQAA